MGLAALTFFSAGGADAISLRSADSFNDFTEDMSNVMLTHLKKHHHHKQSDPACNSDEGCKLDTAAAKLAQEEDAIASAAEQESVPACTSYECQKKDASSHVNAVQVSSDPICSSAGCNYASEKAGPPKDYFVPNFGMDQDIIDSQSHEAQ